MGHEWSFFFNNAGFGEVGITTKCLVYTLRFAKQGSLKYKFSYRSDVFIHENSSSIIVQSQTIAEKATCCTTGGPSSLCEFKMAVNIRGSTFRKKSWGHLASKFSFLVARTSILVAKNYLQEKIEYNTLTLGLNTDTRRKAARTQGKIPAYFACNAIIYQVI